jgi:hypothetical protein
VPRTPSPPAATVDWPRILALRLERQHITGRTTPDRLEEVVGELIGVHAQVMSAAELQLNARIDGLRATDVRDALWEQRRLVKVWAFRQTLHLLTPDDLAEFVLAARSLERWHTPVWLKYFKLTEDEVAALIDAIGEVLGSRPMTRADLVAAVTKRVGKQRLANDMLTGWGTFLAPAAQRGKLIFGPSDGRNVAFVDPSDWLRRPIPASRTEAEADAALGRLIGRYLASFPGASRDMINRWWGGGTRASVIKRALAEVPEPVAEIDVDGQRGLALERDLAALTAAESPRGVRLLPGFDPFTNELPRKVETAMPVARHDEVHRTAGWVTPIVIVDGRVAGTWEPKTNGARGTVEVRPWGRWRGNARKELDAEVERIAAFLDRPLRTVVARPPSRNTG